MKKIMLMIAGVSVLAGAANAQVNFAGGNYTQNFDSLPNSGTSNVWTDNSTLAGWYAARAAGTVVLNADNGASNAGRLSSAGATGDTERALGALGSGSTGTIVFGLQLVNTSGSTIDSFDLSYFGEQWRSSTSTQNVLAFDYRIGGTTITGTDFTASTNLDFTGAAPVTTNGALDGNANRTAISGTVSNLNWTAGSSLWIRWSKLDNVGSDALLAVDDLNFHTNPVPEPATMTGLALGVVAIIRKRRSAK